MRKFLTLILAVALAAPAAACMGASLNEDGKAELYVEPLVGVSRVREGEDAIRGMVEANTDAIKTVVSDEVSASLDAARAEFEEKAALLAAEDEGSRNLLLYGLGLLGLGGMGVAGVKKRKATLATKAEEAAEAKKAETVALAAAVANLVKTTEPGPAA